MIKIPFPRDGGKTDDGNKAGLPVCDWVYFATPSQENWATTKAFADEFGMIIRTVYNSADIPIANVKKLRQGDTVLLVFGGGRRKNPYRPMFSCTIVAPQRPVPKFDAMSYADASQNERLRRSGYVLDPNLG